MLVYSDTIIKFIQRLRQYTKKILVNEVGVQVNRSRFLRNGYLYPINVVVFERSSTIGYYDPETFQIGINKSLLYMAKNSVIKDVLRHEIAHMLLHIDNKDLFHGLDPHGKEYRDLCRNLYWDEDIYSRSLDIEERNDSFQGDLLSEKMIARVQKLLKLADSTNEHEAQLATTKANQILLKHNICCMDDIASSEETQVYVKRVMEFKKASGKTQAIYDILKKFYVSPVYNYGKNKAYLEVTGSKVNVEVAAYVADFLDHELERLWSESRKQNPELKGISHKNSFFKGVANGHLERIENALNDYSAEDKMALTRVEQNLSNQLKMVYGRTSHRAVSATFHGKTHDLGKDAGRKMSIHKGVSSGGSMVKRLLGFDN